MRRIYASTKYNIRFNILRNSQLVTVSRHICINRIVSLRMGLSSQVIINDLYIHLCNETVFFRDLFDRELRADIS